MALLRQYSSEDAGGYGLLTGAGNTLPNLLRSCLVTGYGAFPAAGWTEPIAAAGNIAAFKQGAGSGFHVLVNDNGPNATSTYKEAWVTGWETLAGIGAPVGTGTGQFPIPAQLLTTGHGVVRKSASADAVGRQWRLFADDRTFYLFILSGDLAATYTMLSFGNFYSLSTVADPYACMIGARGTENAAPNTSGREGIGVQTLTPTTAANAAACFFLARAWGGGGGSLAGTVQGDLGKVTGTTFNGLQQYPNGVDNSLYLSPIHVYEPSAGMIRGRLRGVYHVAHTDTNFADSQIFNGAGDYAGKTFQVIKRVNSSAGGSYGFYAIETSNTVETN